MKILIIDDNKDFVDGLFALLSLSGYVEVNCAYNGADGVKAAYKMQPDVLLVDLQMPDMDGFAVIRAVREGSPEFPFVCIAITGYRRDSDKIRSNDTLFDFYLTKPFRFSELRRILELPEMTKSA